MSPYPGEVFEHYKAEIIKDLVRYHRCTEVQANALVARYETLVRFYWDMESREDFVARRLFLLSKKGVQPRQKIV